jgi:hypothetical protein
MKRARIILILFVLVIINSCAFPPAEIKLGAHAIKKCIEKCEWYDEFPYLKFKREKQ